MSFRHEVQSDHGTVDMIQIFSARNHMGLSTLRVHKRTQINTMKALRTDIPILIPNS